MRSARNRAPDRHNAVTHVVEGAIGSLEERRALALGRYGGACTEQPGWLSLTMQFFLCVPTLWAFR